MRRATTSISFRRAATSRVAHRSSGCVATTNTTTDPRRAALALTLIAVATACAGCGGSSKAQTILETKRTIVALALHGSGVAWLAGAPTSSCRLSLWLRTAKRTTVLPLPHAVSSARVNDCSVFGSYGSAAIALAGANVAWLVNEPGVYEGAISEG